jgi:hypothetical protein
MSEYPSIDDPAFLYSSISASPSPQPKQKRFFRRITTFSAPRLYLRATVLRR